MIIYIFKNRNIVGNLLFIAILTVVSCSPKPKDCIEPISFGSKSKKTETAYSIIDDNEYLIRDGYQSAIESCLLGSPDCLKEETRKLGIEGRKVIRRNPVDFELGEENEYHIQLCMGKNGEVVMSRMLSKANQVSNRRKDELLKSVLGYYFEADSTANCLECGKLVYRISGNTPKR